MGSTKNVDDFNSLPVQKVDTPLLVELPNVLTIRVQ